MHLKDDYVRMTRRPLDGQAMQSFQRLADLFNLMKLLILKTLRKTGKLYLA